MVSLSALLGLLKVALELDSRQGWWAPRVYGQVCPQWVRSGVSVVSRLGAWPQLTHPSQLPARAWQERGPDQQGVHRRRDWAQAMLFVLFVWPCRVT